MAKVDPQSQKVLWVYRAGTSKEDALHAMLLEKSGSYLYAAGRTFGHFAGTSSKGQSDLFIIKYDVQGDKPIAVWKRALVQGTAASDAVLSLAVDPKDENIIYATGFTTGNLFPNIFNDNYNVSANGNEAPSGKLSDAFLFSFRAEDGLILYKTQFGTQFADQGAGIVVSDKEDGPIFVSVTTDRKIGQYTFGNFHLYKFTRRLTPLGDVLLRTYSREQVSGFKQHPMLPGSLLSCGSSWLDSRNGYDVFVKRIVRAFDNSSIGSSQVDIDEVGADEYTRRIQSSDGSHDYASAMVIDAVSGRLIVSGYTAGSFAKGASNVGVLAPFIGSVNPLDGTLTDAKQLDVGSKKGWVEILCITMSSGKRGVYYVAKESNESTNQFHLAIGSFDFPKSWKTPIAFTSASQKPTPSPKRELQKSNGVEKGLPLMMIIGVGCGAVALVLIVVAIVMTIRMSRRSGAAEGFSGKKRAAKKSESQKAKPVAGPTVSGKNESGLV